MVREHQDLKSIKALTDIGEDGHFVAVVMANGLKHIAIELNE
jgi:hypothetical protein